MTLLDNIFTTLFQHLILSAGLGMLVFVLCRWVKMRIETQYSLWITAFMLSTLLPILLMAYPALHTGGAENSPQIASKAALEQQITAPQSRSNRPFIQPQIIDPARQTTPPPMTLTLHQGFLALLMILIVGAIWRSARLFSAWLATRKLLAKSRPATDMALIEMASPYPLLTTIQHTPPMAVGAFDPVIILPERLIHNLPTAALKPIILHEASHIRRGDLWVCLLQDMISILFWWSPALRLMTPRIQQAREMACDLSAARDMHSGKAYAQSLVDCARLMVEQRRNLLAMGLFSKKHLLTQRVTNVLTIKEQKMPSKIIIAASSLLLTSLTFTASATMDLPVLKMAKSSASSDAFTPKDSIKMDGKYTVLNAEDSAVTQAVIRREDFTLLEKLMQNGLDINAVMPGDGSLLIFAIQVGATDTAKYLITRGANVNLAVDGDGTPLIESVKQDDWGMAKYLLEQGAQVDQKTATDETALINAAREGHLEMAKLLITAGADVNLGMTVRTHDGKNEYRSPLNQARNKVMRDFLISRGAKTGKTVK